MRAKLLMESTMEKEYSNILMETHMKDFLEKVKCMVQVYTNGLTEESMKVHIRMI